MRCLIYPQNFSNFANTFLLPTVEVKTKYLFPLFSLIYQSALPMIRYKGLQYQYFHNHQFFYCNVSNVVNTNAFV